MGLASLFALANVCAEHLSHSHQQMFDDFIKLGKGDCAASAAL